MDEYKTCSYAAHNSCSGLQYKKEQVPIEFFRKPNKPDTNLYRTCSGCRNYTKKSSDKRKDLHKKLFEESKKDPDFSVCLSSCHHFKGVSLYPREKVPRNLFLEFPDDPDSVCLTCCD